MVNRKYVIITVIAVFVIIGIVSGGLALSGTFKTPASDNDNKNVSNINNTSSSEGQVIVTIQNNTFNPANLTVKPGTTVIWISKDSNIKHMVTGKGFMSVHLTNGQSFSYTFNKTGIYNYYDMDNMNNKNLTGAIIVQ